MTLILHALGLAGVIFLVAEFFPRIQCKSFGTAIVVAVVYGVANYLLFWLLALFAFPLMVVTLGLFGFVINAGLLWITDQIIDDFEIEGIGPTLAAAVAITLANLLLRWILY